MPAGLRGGGWRTAKPRTKESRKSDKPRAADREPRGSSKLRAAQGFGLSPAFALAGAGAVLAIGLVVALASGHRGQSLLGAGQDAVQGRFASLGFRLKTIQLQGASPAAEHEIMAVAGLYRNQPTLGLDLAAIRTRVETVGWVKHARVIRLLPDRVVISIDERPLVAVWQHAGHTAVVDAEGNVVREANPVKFSSLPLVVGEGANTAAAAILPSVTSRPRLMERLEALVRVDDRRWDLRLKDGGLIQLPSSGEEAALIRLDQLDRKARILELGFARIDLRDPEMVAVRPKASQAPGPVSDGV